MSRSYKKNPYVTDHKRRGTKQSKRIANRRVRRRLRDEDTLGRIQHKKYTESWDICDYKWRMSREEAIEWYESKEREYHISHYFKERYPTLESWLNYWEKCHRRKQIGEIKC